MIFRSRGRLDERIVILNEVKDLRLLLHPLSAKSLRLRSGQAFDCVRPPKTWRLRSEGQCMGGWNSTVLLKRLLASSIDPTQKYCLGAPPFSVFLTEKGGRAFPRFCCRLSRQPGRPRAQRQGSRQSRSRRAPCPEKPPRTAKAAARCRAPAWPGESVRRPPYRSRPPGHSS